MPAASGELGAWLMGSPHCCRRHTLTYLLCPRPWVRRQSPAPLPMARCVVHLAQSSPTLCGLGASPCPGATTPRPSEGTAASLSQGRAFGGVLQ